MQSPDMATVQALRRDLALQLARFVERGGMSQVAAARLLRIPQPTLSKIVNARVSELSLELLIKVAVRARIPLVMQTGKDPGEAGVFVSGIVMLERVPRSRLAEQARREEDANSLRLTPEQRLGVQLRHSELLAELHQAGKNSRAAVAKNSMKRSR